MSFFQVPEVVKLFLFGELHITATKQKLDRSAIIMEKRRLAHILHVKMFVYTVVQTSPKQKSNIFFQHLIQGQEITFQIISYPFYQ